MHVGLRVSEERRDVGTYSKATRRREQPQSSLFDFIEFGELVGKVWYQESQLYFFSTFRLLKTI